MGRDSEWPQSPPGGCRSSDGWFCLAVLSPGYPPSFTHVYGFIVYQRAGLHSDVVSCYRLGCGQDRTASSFDCGHSFPGHCGVYWRILACRSHWISAVIVLVLWGLATAMFYPPNHAAMIGSVPAQHRGRGDRGHICPVWSWEHVWDFTGNVVTHRSISLLQWRSFGNADPGQSGHFRKRDEFYVLLDWNHGASGDRVLGHARNRETVSPNG
jgi:hypothetical protein